MKLIDVALTERQVAEAEVRNDRAAAGRALELREPFVDGRRRVHRQRRARRTRRVERAAELRRERAAVRAEEAQLGPPKALDAELLGVGAGLAGPGDVD